MSDTEQRDDHGRWTAGAFAAASAKREASIAKEQYWKERETRWTQHVGKLGREPTTSDHLAFSKSEKKYTEPLKKKHGKMINREDV